MHFATIIQMKMEGKRDVKPVKYERKVYMVIQQVCWNSSNENCISCMRIMLVHVLSQHGVDLYKINNYMFLYQLIERLQIKWFTKLKWYNIEFILLFNDFLSTSLLPFFLSAMWFSEIFREKMRSGWLKNQTMTKDTLHCRCHVATQQNKKVTETKCINFSTLFIYLQFTYSIDTLRLVVNTHVINKFKR